MLTRPLGRTGLAVSPIGLGTVKLGRTAGLKYAAPARLPTDDEALALLRRAHQLGVNLIDTAPAYGVSEQRLGELLPQVAPREHWVICTKVGEVFDPATAASTYDFSPAHIRASVESSLRALRVQHLDMVLLHFRSSDDLDVRTLAHHQASHTLRDLQRAGLVRAIGASTGTTEGARLACAQCDVVMLTLSADAGGTLTGDTPSLEEARRAGAGVLIKKPLGSGRAADPCATVRALLRAPGVHSAVVGTTNPAHLAQLCDSI
jgi:aryl-alcohol dehydrogenase-like predicted oxidoreductase